MFFGKPENYEWYAKRCLIYCRVSTEEQVRHGYSLDAQLEELQAYAKQFCMQVVGVYSDEGISARKEIKRRKGLNDLLESVKRNETDYILFIKLDRWFRSVREYYRVQDTLDAHGVGWKAILEDYDTSTTNGRLNLNIRLSVAQDESDRTADRIKFVNENRIKHGGAVTGSYPLALYSKDGKVCINENKAPLVKGLFEHYENTASMRSCIDYILTAHGERICYNSIKRMLTNPLYVGKYRDNPAYCEAIISTEQFNRVQRIIEINSYTREQSNFFIFSGLIVCPVCGCKMGGWAQHDYKFDRVYLRHRCNRKWLDKLCTHNFTPWENRIEKYLITNIKGEIEKLLGRNKYEEDRRKIIKSDIPKIKRQLERLKNLYVEELIDISDYRKDYERLTHQLEQAESQEKKISSPINTEAANAILSMDFERIYSDFTPQEKRSFWTSFIDKIIAHDKNHFEVVFLHL